MGNSKRETEKHLCFLGCQNCDRFITMLQLISLALLAALLMAILIKEHLCCTCPWDWFLFQGNCYFFSTFTQTWKESADACEEFGAQLVFIKSDEEHVCILKQISKKKGYFWIWLSGINKEGKWLWVDGSQLQWRKYWTKGEPNNLDDEDYVHITKNDWNDISCSHDILWICKKPASPCSR